MAVQTTVEVFMPAMGESVTDGTVLEWHKQEGDAVAADETLVEISTDKVDAEVPAPVAETDGSGNGDAPASAEAPPETDAEAEVVDIVMPQMGESVAEGVVLEW